LREYIKKVFLIPNLNENQEEALIKAYFEDKNKESGQKIIASHLKLVVKLSFRYRRYTSSLFDLISEGNLGLMHALRKFKPSKGIKFATYAVFWVRAYIQDHIRKTWSIFYGKTKELKKKLFSKQGPDKEYSKIDKVNYYTENLTEQENSVESIEGDIDFTEAFFQKNKEDIQKKAIQRAIAQLDERAVLILQERFLKEKKSTLSDLSEKLKISKERIRQIEEKSIDFIKKFVKEECENSKI
jgi:RNA polymerase sigma-32 factor